MIRRGPGSSECAAACDLLHTRGPSDRGTRMRTTIVAPANPHRILWIDDEVRPDDSMIRLLRDAGFTTDLVARGSEGLTRLSEARYDLVLLDLRLPDMFGLSVLDRIASGRHAVPVLVATGYYSEPEVEGRARAAGALAVLLKPLIVSDEFIAMLHRAVDGVPPRTARLNAPYGMVGCSSAIRALVDWIEQVAQLSEPVLITGETGTGKELVARALHDAAGRPARPFVAVNCGALPDALIESELFGHQRGAFTGAITEKAGLFEEADGGTIFLDEIGDLPLPAQSRLLRCLEFGEVRRIGSTKARRVSVRVVTATNRSLPVDVGRGVFRHDLYYRLAVLCRHVPSLRERPGDLGLLAQHFLERIGDCRVRHVGVTAVRRLRQYDWPGNVRELRSAIVRSVIYATSDTLSEHEVALALADAPPATRDGPPPSSHSTDYLHILAAHRWNRTESARALGVSRSTLWRRLRRAGLGTSPHDD